MKKPKQQTKPGRYKPLGDFKLPERTKPHHGSHRNRFKGRPKGGGSGARKT